MNIDIHTKFDSELEKIWRHFESDCDHFVFQCYDWISHWQFAVGERQLHIQPTIIIVTDEDKLVALFPFGIRRILGVKILEFLGGAQSDYNAPLVNPKYIEVNELEKIWKAIEKILPPYDVRLFSRLPENLNYVANPWPVIWGAKLTSIAYAACLSQTIEIFEKRVSPRIRADSKRQLKRLSILGKPEFSFAEHEIAHCKIINAMIEQKRDRYRKTGVRDIFSEPTTQDFYRNLWGKLGESGRIHVSALTLNGVVLATHWGAIYGDRYYWLMPTYAGGEWAKYSVGRLLLENAMRWATENSLKMFDFTIGGEEYKKLWCDQQLLIYDRVDYFSPIGMAFVHIRKSIVWLKSNQITRKIITSIVAGYRSCVGG